jgi:hypothetical protein
MKYGNTREGVSAQASDYEKQVLMRYYYPKALDRFRRYLPVFLPDVMRVIFEHDLYRILYQCQLTEGKTDDDLFLLEYYLDDLYDKTVHPELMKDFWMEVSESLERNDEKLPMSDTVQRWRDAQQEQDEVKQRSYLIAVAKVKKDCEYEAETWRLEQLEQANQSQSIRAKLTSENIV